MDNRIHFFSQNDVISSKIAPESLGIRGRQANEFAELEFPILPGFIIDTELACGLEKTDISKDVKTLLGKCGKIVGKSYGNAEDPMLLKVVFSSNMAITTFPALHNFGLVKQTIDGFAKWVGDNFAANEVLFLVRGMLDIELRIMKLKNDQKGTERIGAALETLRKELKQDHHAKSAEEYMDEYAPFLPGGFFDSAENQIMLTLKEISNMLVLDDQNDTDTALMIQPMVYGNYGKDSCSGSFFSRNVVTGEKKLQGEFYREKFNEMGASGQDIDKIGPTHLKDLEKIAWTLEDKFKEIRQIRFTVENGKLWLIEQRQVEQKSTQSDIKLILDLAKRKIVDEAYVVKSMEPLRLNEILHPIIDTSSVKGLKSWQGGIAGAPGAAIGKVYFTTDALLEARKIAMQKGEDPRFILVMPSTFAEDVKAIEVASGVLSCEGGYSAHASVVARQYGKVSLVAPDMKIKGKKAALGSISFSEGDYITINVPYYGESSVYLGTAKLIEPNPSESGLLEFIDISKKFVKDFHVRANAESPKDAQLALSFGAEGIGLCRTEHMFFGADRINTFREMIFSDNGKDRQKALDKLKVMQRNDFCGIFKAMAGKEVTIRLLDSPLHEFLPHNDDELKAFISYMETENKSFQGRNYRQDRFSGGIQPDAGA